MSISWRYVDSCSTISGFSKEMSRPMEGRDITGETLEAAAAAAATLDDYARRVCSL